MLQVGKQEEKQSGATNMPHTCAHYLVARNQTDKQGSTQQTVLPPSSWCQCAGQTPSTVTRCPIKFRLLGHQNSRSLLFNDGEEIASFVLRIESFSDGREDPGYSCFCDFFLKLAGVTGAARTHP